MKATILIILFTAFCFTASAQVPDKLWQAKAIEKYPTLGVQGSELNKRFVDAYTDRKKKKPDFFANPQWPLVLADELATTSATVAPESPATKPTQSSPVSSTPIQRIDSGTQATPVTPAKAPGAKPQHITQPPNQSDAESPSGAVMIGIAAIVLIGGLLIWVSAANATKRRKHREGIYAEARGYIDSIQEAQALPTVQTSVILKAGENAFYFASSALYETRAVRHHQSGSAGFRVAKGVYIGGTKGRSTSSQEWSKIDSGTLTITNKRLIFDGGSADRSVALGKILSADSSIDSVEVSVESRQKSMAFEAGNPLILATIIRICSQVSDPLHLSETPLNITFTE